MANLSRGLLELLAPGIASPDRTAGEKSYNCRGRKCPSLVLVNAGPLRRLPMAWLAPASSSPSGFPGYGGYGAADAIRPLRSPGSRASRARRTHLGALPLVSALSEGFKRRDERASGESARPPDFNNFLLQILTSALPPELFVSKRRTLVRGREFVSLDQWRALPFL